MSEYAERASDLFKEGYNCSQAVFAAFCPATGLNENTALLAAEGLGGGVGRQREVCGAVTGMAMAAGMLYGTGSPSDPQGKKDLYALIQTLSGQFKAEFGSIICRDLLGSSAGTDGPSAAPRTGQFYAERPCARCVETAAGLLSAQMETKPPKHRG